MSEFDGGAELPEPNGAVGNVLQCVECGAVEAHPHRWPVMEVCFECGGNLLHPSDAIDEARYGSATYSLRGQLLLIMSGISGVIVTLFADMVATDAAPAAGQPFEIQAGTLLTASLIGFVGMLLAVVLPEVIRSGSR